MYEQTNEWVEKIYTRMHTTSNIRCRCRHRYQFILPLFYLSWSFVRTQARMKSIIRVCSFSLSHSSLWNKIWKRTKKELWSSSSSSKPYYKSKAKTRLYMIHIKSGCDGTQEVNNIKKETSSRIKTSRCCHQQISKLSKEKKKEKIDPKSSIET